MNYVLYSVNEDKSEHHDTGVIILKKLNSVSKRMPHKSMHDNHENEAQELSRNISICMHRKNYSNKLK